MKSYLLCNNHNNFVTMAKITQQHFGLFGIIIFNNNFQMVEGSDNQNYGWKRFFFKSPEDLYL